MKLPEVISRGNLLAEVMRLHLDEALHESGTFAGPFPSGDTAIYIDAVARQGGSAGFIGAVGQDDFGHCILDRFARDGVDYSHSQILPQHTTGVAFVAYFNDGSRQFIYYWRHAAAGPLSPTYVQSEYFKAAKWRRLTVASDEEGCRRRKAAGALAVTRRGPMEGNPTR